MSMPHDIEFPAGSDVAGPVSGWVHPGVAVTAEDRLSLDVDETDERIVVTLGLPGFDVDAARVRLKGSTLVVEVPDALAEGQGISRSMILSAVVDLERVTASRDGAVLTITVPKRAALEREIPVLQHT